MENVQTKRTREINKKVIKLKLYVLIRTDINVSIGKLLVHIGHVFTKIIYNNSTYWRVRKWVEKDQHTIIILKTKDLKELKDYYDRWDSGEFHKAKVMIEDTGFYELEKRTIIMCGIGPLSKEEAKELRLNKLSLYRK